MLKKINIKKAFAFLLPITAVLAVILIAIFFIQKNNAANANKRTPFAEALKTYQAKEPEKTSYSVLILGYGGAGHDGGGLADAQILANVDTKNKKVTLIAIPRDSWVNLPVRSDLSQNYKINMAYAIGNSMTLVANKQTKYTGPHGGGIFAKDAAKIVTGIDVDYYAAIDFDRFIKAIDSINGIDVDVPVTFDDEFFPIKGLENETCGFTPEEVDEFKVKYSGFDLEKQFTCRYEHLHFDQGEVHTDGATALKYIRSRHSNQHGGDFARGVREQSVLVAVKNKLLSLKVVDKLDDFYDQFSKMVDTDITDSSILEVLPKLGMPDGYTVNKLNISTDNFLNDSISSDGQYILVPKAGTDNWSEVQNYIKQNL